MSNDSQATPNAFELSTAQPEDSTQTAVPSFTSTNTICPCLIDSSLCTKPISPLSFKSEPTTESTEMGESGQPEWLHFDDTRVKTLTNMEFHRKIIDSSYDSPYILFYVKD